MYVCVWDWVWVCLWDSVGRRGQTDLFNLFQKTEGLRSKSRILLTHLSWANTIFTIFSLLHHKCGWVQFLSNLVIYNQPTRSNLLSPPDNKNIKFKKRIKDKIKFPFLQGKVPRRNLLSAINIRHNSRAAPQEVVFIALFWWKRMYCVNICVPCTY